MGPLHNLPEVLALAANQRVHGCKQSGSSSPPWLVNIPVESAYRHAFLIDVAMAVPRLSYRIYKRHLGGALGPCKRLWVPESFQCPIKNAIPRRRF